YSVLYYDDRYRVVQRKGNNGQHGTESVYTAYNFEGSPTKEKHVHIVPGQASVTEVHTYTYDLANRLLKSVYQLNDKDSITLVDNIYDEVGRLFVDRRNGVPELRTTYSYNLRSWLKGVSSPLFSQTLNYQETINDIAPCYNGNISSLFWRTAQNDVSNELISSPEKGYSFTYDGLSCLKDAVYGEGTSLNQNGNRFNEQITGYDKMGNILGLLRYGQTGTDSYGLIDNLNLTYNGNQLQSVYDNATNSVFGNGMEFKDAAHETVEYAYDKNGNLTKDLNKNITEIQYNILNLPSHISFADGSSIVYEYAADGSKVRTTHTINDNVTSTVYCGNAIYENGSLKMLLNESGYYSFQDNKFHFYIKDHQGNVRVVADETGKVDEVNDYYPFGGLMSNACNNVQPYKYNSKELDRKGGLNWYDYGARHYDATIGRWHAVDLLSEKYYDWSPYNYCLDNPIKLIDSDGKAAIIPPFFFGTANPLVTAGSRMTMFGTADKVVKALPKEEHHIIPRSLGKHDVVKAAREGGFKLEGKENKMTVDKFSKATGEGQHGKHPNYTEQLRKEFDNFGKRNPNASPEQSAKFVRGQVSNAKNAIENNSNTKINDLELKNTTLPTDEIKVTKPIEPIKPIKVINPWEV
ncbi:RHS repeat domain-containing protein, partial [Bacteroides sp. AM16-13]